MSVFILLDCYIYTPNTNQTVKFGEFSIDKQNQNDIIETRKAVFGDGHKIVDNVPDYDKKGGSGGGSGGKITDKNFTQIEKFEKQAERFYHARVNEGNRDVELISSHTDFSYDDIEAIKNHVMVEEHLFSDGTVRKFDPNIDQALAWQRLMENRFTDTDILLLNHELRELKYMKSHECDYETAHKYATQKYDWQSAVDSIIDKDNINPKLL